MTPRPKILKTQRLAAILGTLARESRQGRQYRVKEVAQILMVTPCRIRELEVNQDLTIRIDPPTGHRLIAARNVLTYVKRLIMEYFK